ncbi:DNA-methyltransferase [Leptospira sanjuanensis]|uniref:DNA-methyltransferase n=1 Tax=Leptospira sanjuanensis TaxID=2879643 RepID=UPI001EE91460|nr:site-specific DNA-methyltransferase [Leptospira sanjuanensis]MCG6170257.1 site-specific DNA-methyltransferase [Leptospira sanjuanensis]
MDENELRNSILIGDAFETLKKIPENYFHSVVTSPPYFRLRDYGHKNQIGIENSPNEYLERLVRIFIEVRRVLRPDGSLWIVIGDTYSKENWKEKENPPFPVRIKELKKKDLIGIPWRLAIALQDSGWYLRQDIIWNKPNSQPSSVKDRCAVSHEYLFHFTKSDKYYYDAPAISEPSVSLIPGHKSFRPKAVSIFNNGREVYYGKRGKTARTIRERKNKRTVWTVTTKPSKTSHTATFPPELIEDCIKSTTSRIGVCETCGIQIREFDSPPCSCIQNKRPASVLDPFLGSGTTALVALKFGCEFTGIELSQKYANEAKERIKKEETLFTNLKI